MTLGADIINELNLLQYSTYNVELINKNKELFNKLFNTISKTYKLFNIKDWSESNIRNVSFAPTSSRIANVFITIKPTGEFEIVFRGNHTKLKSIQGTNRFSEYSLDSRLEIVGITHENYQEHIPTIVKAIEYCDYSFL
jgi:hypothetical protein